MGEGWPWLAGLALPVLQAEMVFPLRKILGPVFWMIVLKGLSLVVAVCVVYFGFHWLKSGRWRD